MHVNKTEMQFAFAVKPHRVSTIHPFGRVRSRVRRRVRSKKAQFTLLEG